MDPRLCTHIVYAYASLDPNELKIKPFDMFADIDHSKSLKKKFNLPKFNFNFN